MDRPTQDAIAFANWIVSNGLVLLNHSSSPTHEDGTVIDPVLALRSLLFQHWYSTEVRPDLSYGSDRDILVTTITTSLPHAKNHTGYFNLDKMDEKIVAKTCEKEAKRLKPIDRRSSGRTCNSPAEGDAPCTAKIKPIFLRKVCRPMMVRRCLQGSGQISP